jgi:membrane-bound lytic murein transglycosylase D
MLRSLLLVLLCLPAVHAQGLDEWEIDWQRVGDVATRFELPVQLPPPAQWEAAANLIARALDEGSMQDLARLAPYVRQARALYGKNPQLAALMDWIEPRLDYFDVAEETQRPAPTPVPPRPNAPPPPRPTPRPAPQDPALWRSRVAKKATPRGAEALVPRLKPEFIREGVPPQWVWIAEVESSFNPNARSPVGATGLFQFMPATAQHLGLALSPDDDRRHPEKSARAAARYLRYLHGRFKNWPLVLAAYNAGEGRVSGLLRKHGNSFDAIAPHLPGETRMYVPKVLATVSLREKTDAANLPAPGKPHATPPR